MSAWMGLILVMIKLLLYLSLGEILVLGLLFNLFLILNALGLGLLRGGWLLLLSIL